MKRVVILAAGPLALLLTLALPAPASMGEPAWRVAGLAAWMALWWLTVVVPLEATGLLPLLVLPLIGRGPFETVAVTYADPVIFLFLGGFLIAAALERWALHRRFADAVLRAVGSSPRRVILAFLVTSAFLSMWISNTATAVMMLPIAAATVRRGTADPERRDPYAIATMLAVAFGASLGGVATIIGTPPNAIFVANARELAGAEFTFASWLPIGLSLTVPLLAVCWVILVTMFRVPAHFPDEAGPARAEPARAGWEPGERFVLAVFTLAAVGWVLRTPKQFGDLRVPGLTDLLPGLSDPAVGLLAALLLFAVPLPRSRFRTGLDWESARKIPWGILLLFGGGITLAAGFESSGLSAWIGGRLQGVAGLPFPVVIAATATLFILLTELTSNTATAALAMPLMAGVARGIGVAPIPLMLTAALACSMAFMLPVATPPNAIVFGQGGMRIGDMARAGVLLDTVAVFAITAVVLVWSFLAL